MRKALLILFTFPILFFTFSCQERTTPVIKSNNVEIKAFFSPRGGCSAAIIKTINQAQTSIDIAIYSFTNRKIADALIKAYKRGVKIRIVSDKGTARGRRCVLPLLENLGIPVRYKRGSGGGLMHNKYAVIDRKIVITGSFNWTKSAEYRNDENLLIINNQDLAKIYEENFKKLWELAGLEN